MPSIEELQQEIETIKGRNRKVEADKAWKISLFRKITIIILTYFVIVIFFFFAQLPKPFINAIVPALAFFLSTLSAPILKQWWINKLYK